MLEEHPYSQLIPAMGEDEYRALVLDIGEQGLLDPIVLFEGKILDGRHRHRACLDLNISGKTEEYSGSDAISFVISKNLHRRHLTSSQKAVIATEIEPLLAEEAKARQVRSKENREKNLVPQIIEEQDKNEKTAATQAAKLTGSNRQYVADAKLLKEEDPVLLEKVKSGELNIPQARKVLRQRKVAQRNAQIKEDKSQTCTISDLSTLISSGKKFGTLYVDPPWSYGNQATRASTDNHYVTMSLEDITALPFGELAAENAHLHLWTTNAFLFDCQHLMEAWGFTYKSMFIWAKPQMGMGNYWRVSHEILLFGLKGSAEFGSHSETSWGVWPRGKHSSKPEEIRQKIEHVSPGPYFEAFGRRITVGWTVWGNEIERTMFEQSVPAFEKVA